MSRPLDSHEFCVSIKPDIRTRLQCGKVPVTEGYGGQWTIPQEIRLTRLGSRGRAKTPGPLLHLTDPSATLYPTYSISASLQITTRWPPGITARTVRETAAS